MSDAPAATWSTAVPDWQDRILTGRSLVPELPLDKARADRAVRIFRNLRVPDIPGTPTYGEVCADFVFDLVRAIFGAFDPATQRRMLSEFFTMIPKKNGKSAIAAAIMITAQILNERPSAELMLIAPTQKVAQISFDQAAGIIRLSETPSGTPLEALFHIRHDVKEIRYLAEDMPSRMSIKSADTDVVTGSKASVVLIDETHQFSRNRHAAGILLEIRGGLSHPQNTGFLLQITTQSKEPPAGAFANELKRARAVRDGKLSAPLLAILYELPVETAAEDGWRDPATWGLVNPHLGRSVSAEFLAEQLLMAESDGREALALFASQHLNVEVGLSIHGDGWPGALYWEACGDPGLTLDELIRRSEVAVVGGDMGGHDDLSAIAVLGREKGTGRWLHWVHAWAHPIVFERRKAIGPYLEDFKREGTLTICADPMQSEREIADLCDRLKAIRLLPEMASVGVDAARTKSLIEMMWQRGWTKDEVMAVGQGWHLQSAVLSLPKKLEAGLVVHGATRLMAWAVGNAKVELVRNNWLVTKQASGSAKIDPLMALFDAAFLMFDNPQVATQSYLSRRDPVFV